jgi:FkbM family methyltransferase
MKRTFNVEYFERNRKNHIRPLLPAKRKYVLFPNDNAITSSLIEGWVYEPYLFHFISDNMIELEGTEIVDVGANNGHFTIEFSHYVGDTGKVYAFEPQRVIFQQLCGNIFLNGLDNVFAYNAAIGKEAGMTYIEKVDYFERGNVNFGDVHTINKNSENNEVIAITKLDDIEFQNLSVVKIDVQGFESYVLEGSEVTIWKHRPYIFIEIEEDQLQKYGFTEEKLIKQIERMDYVVKRFQVGVPYQTKSGVCLDCVCIPKEKFEKENYKIR